MIGQLLVPTLAERKESLDLTKGVVFLLLIGFYGSYMLFSFFRDMRTFSLYPINPSPIYSRDVATTKERETYYLSYYSIVLLYSYSTGKAEGAYYFDRGATDV